MLSKEEFIRDFADFNEDKTVVSFNMPVNFDELADNRDGINFLNDRVDDMIEKGFELENLSYLPLSLSGETIIVQVTADCTGFLGFYV